MKDLKDTDRYEVLVGDQWIPACREQLERGDIYRVKPAGQEQYRTVQGMHGEVSAFECVATDWKIQNKLRYDIKGVSSDDLRTGPHS